MEEAPNEKMVKETGGRKELAPACGRRSGPQCHQHTFWGSFHLIFTASLRRNLHYHAHLQMRKLRISEISNLPKSAWL